MPGTQAGSEMLGALLKAPFYPPQPSFCLWVVLGSSDHFGPAREALWEGVTYYCLLLLIAPHPTTWGQH